MVIKRISKIQWSTHAFEMRGVNRALLSDVLDRHQPLASIFGGIADVFNKELMP